MLTLRPVKGSLFIKWLHSGLFKDAASLECHSCENFLSEGDIQRFMHQRRVGGFVIADLTKPVGYVIYEKDGATLEIINLVVHSDYRRRGCASLLIDKLKTRKDWRAISVSVRESNLGAQQFLKELGFVATEIKRRFFEDHYAEASEFEDAYHFEFRKTDHENNNPRSIPALDEQSGVC